MSVFTQEYKQAPMKQIQRWLRLTVWPANKEKIIILFNIAHTFKNPIVVMPVDYLQAGVTDELNFSLL